MYNMANYSRRWLKILIAVLLALVVVGLVGHFIVDVSGDEPLPTAGIHGGLILLSLIAVVGVLMLVNTLFVNNPISYSYSFPPHVQPPISLF